MRILNREEKLKKVIKIEPEKTMQNRNCKNKQEKLRVAAYCRVSTDDELQLKSCDSQVQYYTDLIKSNSEWEFAGIYVDEGISGKTRRKRPQFQKMIQDAEAGHIDYILVKSISRFARNLRDTLEVIEKLQKINVIVKFEENNIQSDSDKVIIAMLSSISEQEVTNISSHVYKGLTMKMDRGEIIGFSRCLGYRYDRETKQIVIVENEAEIVRQIFELYSQGMGCRVIAKRLNNEGHLTIKGNKWTESGVMGIIKNEKYVGDLLQGKTVTTDTYEKTRVRNNGYKEKYFVKDAHEAIITRELFAQTQQILEKRKVMRIDKDGVIFHNKLSRQFTFSCLLKCGYCGNNLSRRTWHSGTTHEKIMWQCVKATKKGKKYCPSSKGISEREIESAFVEAYNMLFDEHKDILNSFIARVEKTLQNDDIYKNVNKIKRNIANQRSRLEVLLNKNLDGLVDDNTYKMMSEEMLKQIEQFEAEKERLELCLNDENNIKERIKKFKEVLSSNKILDTFDRCVFESVIDRVIVGGFDKEGKKDPYKLVFVFKDGIFKEKENLKIGKNLCSDVTFENETTYSNPMDGTCGNGSSFVPTKTE